MSELIDNRARRIATLKEIIKDLHAGAPQADVKQRLKELVRHTDSTEIAAMEQELIADGMPLAEVKGMCDVHAAVLRDITVNEPTIQVSPGHPLDQLQRENEAITELVARSRRLLHDVVRRPEDAPVTDMLPELRHLWGLLGEVEKHYRRKENLVFSCLERHFIFGPSKVMWGKDDEVRAALRASEEILGAEEVTAGELAVAAAAVLDPALEAVDSMVLKETAVLFPMLSTVLTEREWAEIWEQSPEYGWCLVEPRSGYVPAPRAKGSRAARVAEGESLAFPTGNLDVAQLRGLLGTLPLDVTFVDADDRVAYFSEGAARVFPRSKAILGRKVQHCHPPGSVHIVEQIVGDFRSGSRSVAEFWIELHGRFVHIRYFAVRDEAGAYLGTLEVTQDLTPLRALSGERRLLQYDDAEGAP